MIKCKPVVTLFAMFSLICLFKFRGKKKFFWDIFPAIKSKLKPQHRSLYYYSLYRSNENGSKIHMFVSHRFWR